MDTTSLYFEGEGGQTLGQRGFSKDHRPDLNQMILAALLDGADSDEAGHAFQNEAGHLFRSEAGRGSDLKPATQRMRPRIEAMMFRRGGLVKRAWVLGRRERRSLGGL
jgi:hypothetical protein